MLLDVYTPAITLDPTHTAVVLFIGFWLLLFARFLFGGRK